MPDFKFRLPSINDLTDLQQVAYYDRRPMLITGGPGSGKTVVSLFRFLRQIMEDQNAIFFTFNRTLMSAVRGTLRQQADIRLPLLKQHEIEEIINTKVASVFEWYGANFHEQLTAEIDEAIKLNFQNFSVLHLAGKKYSELFIDESQDLRPGILAASYELANKVSCGADRSQDLQGHYVGPADDVIFNLLYEQERTIRQGLTSNFRNTKEIFDFARNFVPEDDNVQQIDIDELPVGEKPEIMGNLSEQKQLSTILQIIQQNPNSNIGILVHTSPQIKIIKEFLESNNYSCADNTPDDRSFSYYYSNMPHADKIIVETRLKTPFILTFESCKGLEFDIVIMPLFEKSDWALNNYKPNNSNPDKDAKGNAKTWSTPNHYYVGCTRARSLLYVLYNQKPRILGFL
ncbi:Uncharacterized conserved protein [Chitinophaga sp. CF118]|uniref:DNA/RNA helicase domain-containing protein n=1 Tax=Chitinophaga sp. CF118 TaxID=1884367 RepID=UPI0008EDD7F6|nr:DNA/RNA helicase domain-containing protein [Chitinophaga sp. CF118]SFE67556.1 Uncharacterized conserved protein [Chitinophaga sp. CF118]